MTVFGTCHFAASVNYVIFGAMCALCYAHYDQMWSDTPFYDWDLEDIGLARAQFTRQAMVTLIWGYKRLKPWWKNEAPREDYEASKRWAKAGWDGWPWGVATPVADRAPCATKCPYSTAGPFTVSWYPFLNPYTGA